jgi:hypothetical protein
MFLSDDGVEDEGLFHGHDVIVVLTVVCMRGRIWIGALSAVLSMAPFSMADGLKIPPPPSTTGLSALLLQPLVSGRDGTAALSLEVLGTGVRSGQFLEVMA